MTTMSPASARPHGTPPTEIRFTVPELAARLRIRENTLRQWRMKGEGPRAIKVGRLVRYRLEDVEAWENEHLEDER